MRPPASSLIAFALALGLALPVVAQSESDAPEAAMAALKLARHHYGKGNHKEAARLFLQAWDIHPLPDFLYNAGRAEQRAFMLVEARRDFRKVIRLAPPKSDILRRAKLHLREVEEALGHVSRIKSEAKEQAKERAAPPVKKPEPAPTPKPAVAPPVTPPEPAQASSWQSWAGWALVGAGVVVAGAGGYFWLDAQTEQGELDRESKLRKNGKVMGLDWETYSAWFNNIDETRGKGQLLTGIGVAMAAVGGVWLWTRPERASATLAPTRDGLVGAVTLRF